MKVSSGVNAVRTKYMFMSHEQNAWQNYKINIANKSPEKVAKLKYFAIELVGQNCMLEGVKSRLKLEEASYHSGQNLLSLHYYVTA